VKNWPALLVAPMLALSDQTTAYTLVGWSCASQQGWPVHAAHLLFALATIAVSLPAWLNFTRDVGHPKGDEGAIGDRPRFLAMCGAFVGLLSLGVILAMWYPTWVLSPCFG
jgi:hypothetical protein